MKSTELAKVNEQPLVAINSEDPMLSMIDRVCSDPNFDIAKMEKMIDMRNAEFARVAKIDFNRSFAEMQSKLPRVITGHKNDQTSSMYAKIEDINDAVLPVLAQYGFGISFRIVKQDNNGVTVGATLKHSGGHEDSTQLLMPYDNVGIKGSVNKTNIHATGSTITYAKRYAMCMLLDISTGTDTDGSLSGFKKITNATAEEIKSSLKDTDSDVKKFLQYMNVDCVENIMTKDFEKANRQLLRKVIAKKEEKPLFKDQENETN